MMIKDLEQKVICLQSEKHTEWWRINWLFYTLQNCDWNVMIIENKGNTKFKYVWKNLYLFRSVTDTVF